MLSVVTVCYNSEKTIERTIKSVLEQSTDQVEHIFVDGDSKDKTVSIIESYQGKYEEKGIKMTVISEKDKGIYDAMNKGIRLSTGSVIGFLNSDDWYETDTVSVVMEAFNNNPKADIVMGAAYIHNGTKILVKRPKKSIIITSRNFNFPGMFVRRECYQSVGFYEECDFDWYLRALKKKRQIAFIKNILVNFSAGGVSTQIKCHDILRNIKYRYKLYRNNGYSRFYFLECVVQDIAKYFFYAKKK